jgi:uncharacterized RDD family membrane protein YckC
MMCAVRTVVCSIVAFIQDTTMTEEKDWYYSLANQQLGPVDERSLHQLIASGEITPATLVWCEGSPQWTPASKIESLAAVFASLMAPPAIAPRSGDVAPVGLVNDPFVPSAAVSPAPVNPNAMASPAIAPPTQQGDLRYGRMEAGTKQYSYAGFWRRLLAWIIDAIVLLFISTIIGMILPPLLPLMGFIIGGIYYAAMESSVKRGTLGKLMSGLQVVRSNGEPLTFGRAIIRYIGRYLNLLTLGIGFLMIAFTARKQGLHDMIADTVVLRPARAGDV